MLYLHEITSLLEGVVDWVVRLGIIQIHANTDRKLVDYSL